MPRRTNVFQELITLIERGLAPLEATVTGSATLVDRGTGGRREVDIVIEHRVGNHKVIVSIECTAGTRKASVQWVDRMIGTHGSLPTNKLILVSQSGFTPEAIRKAEAHGATTLSLEQAKAADWAAAVRSTRVVKVEAIVLPSLVKATVILDEHADSTDWPTAVTIDQARLVAPNAAEAGEPVRTVVETWLRDPATLKAVDKAAVLNAGMILEFQVPMRPGVSVEVPDGRRYPVHALKVRAQFGRHEATVDLAQATYGDAAVAHGRADVIGRPVDVVMVQRPGENASIAFKLPRTKPTRTDTST